MNAKIIIDIAKIWKTFGMFYAVKRKHLGRLALGMHGIFNITFYDQGFILSICELGTIRKKIDIVFYYKPFELTKIFKCMSYEQHDFSCEEYYYFGKQSCSIIDNHHGE